MKKLTFRLLLFCSAIFIFTSCDWGKDPDPGGTTVEKMAGEWWITSYLFTDDVDTIDLAPYGVSPFKMDTYNTAANVADKIWVDDHENFWGFKFVSNCNLADKSFSGTDLENTVYPITISVLGGNVWELAATTSGGNISDSIRIDLAFSDDPSGHYILAGYRRTGFPEDDH